MIDPNHLGAERKRWKLTPAELARLLGYRFRTVVWRAETCDRTPSLRFALACEVVFGKTARELFPALYAAVEDAVMRCGAQLDAALRDDFSHEANVKRELLRSMAERAGKKTDA